MTKVLEINILYRLKVFEKEQFDYKTILILHGILHQIIGFKSLKTILF